MHTLVDNLVAALQNKLASGEETSRVDPEVFNEFMREFPSAAPLIKNIPAKATQEFNDAIAPDPSPVEAVSPAPSPVAPVPSPVEAVSPAPVALESIKPEEKESMVPAMNGPEEKKDAFSMPEMPVEPVAQAAPPDIGSLNLEELRIHGNTCSACNFSLGENRSETTAINEQAELMVITEPAGRSDEYMSDPFHGEAGSLLLKMIRAMNINSDSIYLCMAHRCYGPGARGKIGESKPYLQRQIDLVNPKAILIFGGAALNILLGEQSLMNCRGRWLEIGDIPAIATFPPAYLIHKAESKKDAWNDMQQVMSRLQA